MLSGGWLEVDWTVFYFQVFVFFLFWIFVSRDVATVVVGGGLDGRRGRGGRTVPRQRHLTEAWLTPDDVGMFAKNGIDKNNKIAKQVEKWQICQRIRNDKSGKIAKRLDMAKGKVFHEMKNDKRDKFAKMRNDMSEKFTNIWIITRLECQICQELTKGTNWPRVAYSKSTLRESWQN